MIRAVLFDLEGTLLQTEALEALTFAYAVTELRPDLDETEVARSCMALGDRPRPEVADELLRRFDLERAARERAREIGAWTPRLRWGALGPRHSAEPQLPAQRRPGTPAALR